MTAKPEVFRVKTQPGPGYGFSGDLRLVIADRDGTGLLVQLDPEQALSLAIFMGEAALKAGANVGMADAYLARFQHAPEIAGHA